MTPDKNTFNAIIRLKENRDFLAFLEWRRKCWQDAAEKATNSVQPYIKDWISGQAVAVQVELDYIDNAKAKIETIDKEEKEKQNEPKGAFVH